MTHDTPLKTFRLGAGITLAPAAQDPAPAVTLDSPARHVMTDLTLVTAVTTSPSTALLQAEQLMIQQRVRLLFVVSDMPALEGLITSTDLHGEAQMRAVHERGLHYDELRVADVMTRLEQLDAIDLAELRSATVANIIGTLKRFGRNHLLVVERGADGGRPRVRGLISRTQIERQLGRPVDVTQIASSFAEIERALH